MFFLNNNSIFSCFFKKRQISFFCKICTCCRHDRKKMPPVSNCLSYYITTYFQHLCYKTLWSTCSELEKKSQTYQQKIKHPRTRKFGFFSNRLKVQLTTTFRLNHHFAMVFSSPLAFSRVISQTSRLELYIYY